MADIELVIKIPEGVMEYIKNNDCLAVSYIDEVAKAIKNGTPLPEHHGRLIDADKYIENKHKTEWLGDDVKDEYLEEISVDTFNESTPTIIPATKEGENNADSD